MSDDLDIRAGGAIAVDTATLHRAAAALLDLADDCALLARALRAAGDSSLTAGLWHPAPASGALAAAERARALADALRARALAYELMEGDAALRAGQSAGLPAAVEAARLLAAWRGDRHAEMDRQILSGSWMLGWVTPLLLGGTAAIREVDRGVVAAGDPPLRLGATPARVRELSRTTVAPPVSLADVADRIPRGEQERVRVEVYEMPDGHREYAVYITGTREIVDADEPWDMTSNMQLYFGAESSSFDAVRRAVDAAGAVAGDRVHIAGHSQGGMLATHLAREGGFDVATLITFASPVQAELPGSVLTVALRHTDDPVAALAAGGLPGIAGSPDSLVVERAADPVARPSDITLAVHGMVSYRETAALVDASDDPRVGALRGQLAGLGAATAVTAVVYGARRERPAPEETRRR